MTATKCIGLITVFMVCAAAVVQADNGWGLFGSYWSPQDGSSEFGPGGKLSIEIVEHALLDIRGAYYQDVSHDEGDLESKLTVTPVEAGLTVTGSPVSFMDIYGGLGMGYYFMDGDIYLSDGEKQDANPDDEIGYYFLLGTEFNVTENIAQYGGTRVTVFVEAMYRFVTLDEISVENRTYRMDDASLDGLVGNAGIMIRW